MNLDGLSPPQDFDWLEIIPDQSFPSIPSGKIARRSLLLTPILIPYQRNSAQLLDPDPVLERTEEDPIQREEEKTKRDEFLLQQEKLKFKMALPTLILWGLYWLWKRRNNTKPGGTYD